MPAVVLSPGQFAFKEAGVDGRYPEDAVIDKLTNNPGAHEPENGPGSDRRHTVQRATKARVAAGLGGLGSGERTRYSWTARA